MPLTFCVPWRLQLRKLALLAVLFLTAGAAYIFAFSSVKRIARKIVHATWAILLRPKNTAAYHDRALAFRAVGWTAWAIRDLTTVLKICRTTPTLRNDRPLFSLTYYFRAQAHTSIASYEKASDDYTAAIELTDLPDQRSLFFIERASCVFRLGRPEQALRDCEQAIRLNAVTGRLGRSRVEAELGNYEQALADINLAVAADPNYLLERAKPRIQFKQFAAALADCDELIRVQPEGIWSYQVRSQAYRGLGDLEKSAADEAKAKELTRNLEKLLRSGPSQPRN